MLLLMSTWSVLKDLVKKNCLIKNVFIALKAGAADYDGKKLDGHKSDADYFMCKKIWKEFNMKNMGNYHDHYLKKDVLLLADVFERFIDTCLKFYGLDLCHFFSSPRFTSHLMLKMTGVELEKISDIDIYYLLKKGWEEEFLALLKDTVKQITNTWKIMTLKYHQNTFCTLIWIICMVGQWVVIFLNAGLGG